MTLFVAIIVLAVVDQHVAVMVRGRQRRSRSQSLSLFLEFIFP